MTGAVTRQAVPTSVPATARRDPRLAVMDTSHLVKVGLTACVCLDDAILVPRAGRENVPATPCLKKQEPWIGFLGAHMQGVLCPWLCGVVRGISITSLRVTALGMAEDCS